MSKSNKNQEVEVQGVVEVELADSQIGVAFEDAIKAKKGEDEVKMDMIAAGSSFKTVTRQFNELMVATGRAISKEDKDELVSSSVEDVSTEEGFDAAVAALMEKSDTFSEKSAAGLVRAYAKKNEMDCYKKVTSSGNRNPFVANFHEALIANPNMDEDGLNAVIDALDPVHQVNPRRWFSQHNTIRKTVNKVAESCGL